MTHIHVNSTSLLGIDQHATVLLGFAAANTHNRAYCAYGSHPMGGIDEATPGFNGNVPDPFTGWYLLGNGYRGYNPILMRFVSPDDMSPFGRGGLNAYGYCAGDPVNLEDPSGHFGWVKFLGTPFRRFARAVGITKKVKTPVVGARFKMASNELHVPAGGTPRVNQALTPPHPAQRETATVSTTVAGVGGTAQRPSIDFDRYTLLAKSRARSSSITSERRSPLPITPWDGTMDFRQPSGITRKFRAWIPYEPEPRPYPIELRPPMPLPSDIRNT